MILLMYEPVAAHLENLKRIAGSRPIAIAASEEEAKTFIATAEIVLGNRYFIQALPFANHLRWMQSNSVGVDLILTRKTLLEAKRVILTCARGVYDHEMAEHTLALILSSLRKLPLLRDHQNSRTWQRHRLGMVHSTRFLILGWGSLAKRIAHNLGFLGGIVSAVRNQEHDTWEGEIPVFGHWNWKNQLSQTDVLIICLPKTDDTHHFVGAAELSLLSQDGCVVNVGRGGTLDEHALVEWIRQNPSASAALDVFEHEPLQPDHPIWNQSRIFVSPHVGRSLEGPDFKWFGLFEENLSRYLNGGELLNVVDYAKGY